MEYSNRQVLALVTGLHVPEAPGNPDDNNYRKLKWYLDAVYPDGSPHPGTSVHIGCGGSVIPWLDSLKGCRTIRVDPDKKQLSAYGGEYRRLSKAISDAGGSVESHPEKAETFLKKNSPGFADHITVFNLFNYDDTSGGHTFKGDIEEFFQLCLAAVGHGPNKTIFLTNDIIAAPIGRYAGKRSWEVLEEILAKTKAEYVVVESPEQLPLEGSVEDGENRIRLYKFNRT
jgi:hypothetical protein